MELNNRNLKTIIDLKILKHKKKNAIDFSVSHRFMPTHNNRHLFITNKGSNIV